MESYNSTQCRDGLFGPSVWSEGCRGGFDFTLAFHESILSIAPSVLFLLLAAPRSIYLVRLPDKAKKRAAYTPKLVVSTIYAILQIALLALVASNKKPTTRFSLASAILRLLAALFIVLLAHFEHVKSIRPSFLLTAYLFASLLFDAARLRTEWLMSVRITYAAVLSTSAVFKLALLVLETIEKRKILVNPSKAPSKESTSGPFSRGFFVWLNSLLLSGWGTALTNNDLPVIYEKLSSEKLAIRFGKIWGTALQNKKPSVFLTTIRVLKWEILSIVPPRVAIIALSISQPFLISNALRFLSAPETDATNNLGYGLIGAFAFVFIGSALMTAWYEYLAFRAGAMVRGGLITLIYSKMMKLPSANLSESSAIALMGNDIEMLTEKIHIMFVESWANAVTVGISMYLLADQLGAVCVAPIITALISISLSSLVGRWMVPRQTVYQKATQNRINFTSEVLSSMKAVKMLGLTERFRDLIAQKRDEELEVGIQFRWISVWANCITNCNISLTEAITFAAYAIAAKISGGAPFSAAQAITTLSILGVMMDPLSQLVGNIPHSFSAFGCFKRIQEFLLLDELIDFREIHHVLNKYNSGGKSKATQEVIQNRNAVQLDTYSTQLAIVDGSFSWGEKEVLKDITTSFPHDPSGSLTMIIGPVGSGKSSLLKAILGEVTSSSGVVSLKSPEIAFCDQTPWVMNATIRANIIAESKGFDSTWYDTVLEACDLTMDLSRLPRGDLTVVGDKGVKLSGGQKQRLAIARAVYSRKPIAIFDDVFSGLDKVTEQVVFTRVFGKKGLLRENGTTTILATHAVHRLPESDHIVALDHHGKVVEQGSFPALRSSSGYVSSLDISSHFKEYDTIEEEKSESGSGSKPAEPETITAKSNEQHTSPSDMSIFFYYFKAIKAHNLALKLAATISEGFIAAFRYVWITWWGDGKGHASSDLAYWATIYAVMSLMEGVLITIAIGLGLLVIGPTSGRTLHRRILDAAMSAPMYFLANTDTGSLINRFSQDIRLVDITLPLSLSVFLFEIMACLGAAGLAIAAVSWFAISIPFVVAVLVLIQRFYVRTSKQLRLLELEHKAPLFSHFLESIHGLATIRAFGWIRPYTDRSLSRLDDAQKPAYLLNCIQRWLTLVLDMVVALLTVILVVFAVTLKGKINPSLLGVALVNMMRLGSNMKGIIISWSTLETSLGAITRIENFSRTTPSELLYEDTRPQNDWPKTGTLDVNNISVQYDQTAEPVLRGISFKINHGEKLGICGRSGSGKSSFVQALLRMSDVVEGQIILDGEDITTVPRSVIRQKMSCLTQDPFLFRNTIRFNADPLGKATDEEIVNTLQRVGIWSVITAKVDEVKSPLDEKMDESFLSHGQRQLFCLGRALLKRSSVLILDEPTSSVDKKTDAMVQEVIRTEFPNCTIIMIAHRIDTLLDFDKVAVLNQGSLVEFGTPQELLGNNGAFSKLYHSEEKKER